MRLGCVGPDIWQQPGTVHPYRDAKVLRMPPAAASGFEANSCNKSRFVTGNEVSDSQRCVRRWAYADGRPLVPGQGRDSGPQFELEPGRGSGPSAVAHNHDIFYLAFIGEAAELIEQG